MKNCSLVLFSFFFVSLLQAQHNPKVKSANRQIITNSNSVYLNTVDIAVNSIDFKAIKKATGSNFRIIGTVKNIGGKDFISNTNQQSIQLCEIHSYTENKLVKQIPFKNLKCNEKIKIVFERPEFKIGKEFVPDYQVIIVFDPDIVNDNNTNNDDAILSNNSLIVNPGTK
ncbi:MAG: hypothetical protein WBO31_08695 [Saprospiraceae bacterium]